MPWIDAHWAGICADCGRKFEAGDKIFYRNKTTYCEECGVEAEVNLL